MGTLYIFAQYKNNKQITNHISALVEPAVEVGEVEGEEGDDVSEGSSLQQNYQDDDDDGDDGGDDYEYGDEDDDEADAGGDGEIRRSPAGWLDQDS